jgi:Uri superfamily endonuclease
MRNEFLKDPDNVIEDLNIDTDLALKLQSFSNIVPKDGMVNVGDKLILVDELINNDFGEYTVLEILKCMATLKEAHQERVDRVKAEMKYIEALCIAQKKENDDGTMNVFLTKEQAAEELTNRLKEDGQSVDSFDADRLQVDSQLFFDESENAYYYIVEEVKEEMTDDDFDKLWKGNKSS